MSKTIDAETFEKEVHPKITEAVLDSLKETPREPAIGLEPEQVMLRRTGIGGSEIAVLCGLSRFMRPIDLFQAKVMDVSVAPTVPMQLGNLLEEPIASLYRARTGKNTGKVATLRHPDPDFRFAIATPDRGVFCGPAPIGAVRDQGPLAMLSREQLQDAERLLQCKSTTWRWKHEWGAEDSDEVPPDYLVAEVWAMGVAGLQVSDFGVLFDKDRFCKYTVAYSQELFEDLYVLAEKFMVEHVLPQVPPPPDASAAYAEFVKRVFPQEDEKAELQAASDDVADLVLRYAELRGAAKVLNTVVGLYKSRIKNIIGNGVGFSLPFGSVTWKKSADTRGVDWQEACGEAQLIASLLLNKFGDQLPAEDRARMTEGLRSLEATHQRVTRRGARKLHLGLAKEFKKELMDGLSGIVEDSEKPPRAVRIEMKELCEELTESGAVFKDDDDEDCKD